MKCSVCIFLLALSLHNTALADDSVRSSVRASEYSAMAAVSTVAVSIAVPISAATLASQATHSHHHKQQKTPTKLKVSDETVSAGPPPTMLTQQKMQP